MTISSTTGLATFSLNAFNLSNAGAIAMGSSSVDTGVFTMTKGAQTSDPNATLTMSADGVGALTLATANGSNGDITLTPSGGETILTTDLTVSGGDIVLGTTSIFSGGDTASLNNIDAIDATTETTLEAAIDALSSLVTVGTVGNGTWAATDVGVAYGGTGVSTLADGGLVIGNAAGAVEVVAAGATTEILVGGGASTAPVWTTAQGTGAPVRAGTPTLTTPVIGAATGTSLIVTGTISGQILPVEDADGDAALSAADCRGQIYYNNTQANTYILPAAAAGLNVCFYSDSAHAITIRPLAAGDDHIFYLAEDCGEDDDLVGPATQGSFICLHAKDAADWMALGSANTWTCE